MSLNPLQVNPTKTSIQNSQVNSKSWFAYFTEKIRNFAVYLFGVKNNKNEAANLLINICSRLENKLDNLSVENLELSKKISQVSVINELRTRQIINAINISYLDKVGLIFGTIDIMSILNRGLSDKEIQLLNK